MRKTFKLILVAVMVFALLIPFWGTSEGYVPSPSVDSIYGVKSDYFKLSSAPYHLTIYDVMLVDFDDEEANVYDSGLVEGDFTFPVVSERLVLVFLFDGFHIAQGSFNMVTTNCIRARFFLEDLREFSTFTGLYLILVEYMV